MIIESFAATDTDTSFADSSLEEQHVATPATERELIENHLHLVHSAVARIKRSVPAHIDADDLQSIGLAGLVSAVRRYNPVQGRTFAGYAAMRVRGAMLDELRRLDSCSRRARARARQLKETTGGLEQKLGREVTAEEVRAELGLSREEYGKWVEEAQPVGFVAIDRSAEVDEGPGSSLHDLLADEQDETGRMQLEKEERIRLLARRIEELPTQQRRILAMHYHQGMRIGEIARAFGVTSSRVSQLHARALAELKAWLTVAQEA
jgi:RNA polymerase sigma factor for flagellar operon FliA